MFRRLALPPLGKPPILFAVLIGAVLPLGIALVVVMQVSAEQVSPAMMLLVQGAVAVTSLAIVLPMWRREAAFDGGQLRVKATFYTRQSALADFDLAAARVVDLRERTELKPIIKTNGYALPGLSAGHFRLRDKRRAFVLITDPSRVLYLPHSDGRLWLLSLEHPQAVLDILRRAAA
ncbi:PH domain-containing protein [Arenimonas alkanexedens]